MSNVYIVAAKRTAMGSFLGSLKDISASELAAGVIRSIIAETGIDSRDIDEVILGNILPAGQGQGIARQAAIKAGVDVSVPAYSINMVCGSGMKSVMLGFTALKAGLHHLVLAGGTESMSQSPYLIPASARTGIKMGEFTAKDHMMNDALTDAFENYHMGITAENVAEKYRITREEQDRFAYDSQQKAIAAIDSDQFKDEIVPVKIKVKREEVIFDQDEYPNRKTNYDKLSSLRTAFKKDGTVSAGSSSGINDGSSIVLLADDEMIDKYQLKPLVKVIGIGQGGVEPSLMGLGPTVAIRHALNHAGLKLEDIDIFELNEAFAAQGLGVIHELSEEHGLAKEVIMDRTNLNGGAIALGHPVGASGNRIIVTLVYQMLKRDVRYGIASLCIGGGMGTAVILEKLK